MLKVPFNSNQPTMLQFPRQSVGKFIVGVSVVGTERQWAICANV